MEYILMEILSGQPANEWILECQAGLPKKKLLEKLEAEHPIEKVGAELCKMMLWLQKK
jgi:ketol-acid reductoisomerase